VRFVQQNVVDFGRIFSLEKRAPTEKDLFLATASDTDLVYGFILEDTC
jgi:hypothetical protein